MATERDAAPERKGTDPAQDKLVQRFQAEYQAGWEKDRENQEEAYRDLRLIGDDKAEHWDNAALVERTDEGRPALIVNQCPQFVRQVTGDMRQLKPAIKVVPIDDRASKEVAAKVLPGMIRYIEQRSHAQYIYFSAADQQAGCGIAHWHVTHEYSSSRTFDQEIRIEPIPDGVAVVWDPDSVMPDRSDAKYCFVPVDMARRVFEQEYPDASADPLSPSTYAAWTSWYTDDHVRVATWYYIDKEKKLLALYPDGGIDDVTDDEEGAALARQMGARLEQRDGHCVYRALVSGHEILEGPEKWPGPDIPVVPLIGEEVQIGRKVVRRGVVRVLRDVQRIYNYGISTKTELIALQPKSPWIGTDAQFEKYQDEWETANNRNHAYLRYTNVAGVPPPARVSPATNTQSLDGLLVEMQGAMNATTGIYPAALGAKSNETSGRAIMARQREGDTGTYVYVSNFACAVQRTGQIIVNMIPQIYDTKRTIQIAGEDGKIDQLPINQPGLDEQGMGPGLALNDVTIGAYQVAIEMGPSFSSKREEAREGMTELLRVLGPQGALLFIDLLVKQMDWPLSDKIAERAKFLLPPPIQQKEAMEAGEPPPAPPPPPPPTPEQMQAIALEQEKAAEQRQANIELARKNEVEDRKAQLEAERLELERMTMPAIAEMQIKMLELKRDYADLQLQLRQKDVEHGVEKGTMEFNLLQLKQACSEDEMVQQSIEKARQGELEDRRQQIELRKLDGEDRAIARGEGEEVQAGIEMARKNELAERQFQSDVEKFGFERERLDFEREALRKPAEDAAKQQEIDMVQQKELDELKEMVGQIANVVLDMRAEQQAAAPAEPAAPAAPARDPELMDILRQLARRPTGARREKNGEMRLIYPDEAPPPPTPSTLGDLSGPSRGPSSLTDEEMP